MSFAILTFIVAISISGVAAYYSIIGLTSIFPAAFIPIIVMGIVLEIGKLITASWLYRNWKQTSLFFDCHAGGFRRDHNDALSESTRNDY